MTLTYAVAQIQSERNQYKRNLKKHLQLIDMAAQRKARFILFPELSLTGYERELAAEQSFKPNDMRLKELQQAAMRLNMIIAVGGPLQLQDIARQYHIPVLMSNYCGNCWDTKAGGGSTIWSENGSVVITAKKDQECLLLAERDASGWKGSIREL